MSRTFAEIAALYHERKKRRAPEFAIGQEVRDHYNGDVVIPLPELDKGEAPAVANLLALGLDQMSMRSSSTEPEPLFAPLRPGFKKSEQDADDRRKCVYGWWDQNDMTMIDSRRYRHFYGYGNSPVMLVPDFDRKIPTWQTRDPLMTYPAPSSNPDEMHPDDCIFTYHKPLRWLKMHYPDAYNKIARYRGNEENLDEVFEVIEYVDHEIISMGVLGTKKPNMWDMTINGQEAMELTRTPNRAEVCTAVIPGRVTLDKPQGQYDGMLGMYQQQAMLQALSVVATKKGIFKDEWIIARPGEVPRVIKMANGLKGQVGIIQGGDIKEMSLDPSYMTPQMIDRLERMQRVEGGIPAQFGGETSTNIRTGRLADGVLGATIDFTVQEAQRTMARSRMRENKIAIAIDKGYWRRPKSFYVPWNGEMSRLDYNPQELWQSDQHIVEYSHAGVDENGLTIEVGQLVGLGLIGKDDGRRMHPRIRDPKGAGERVVKEAMETALLSGLQQAISQPGANIADFARMTDLITQEGVDIAKAILQVQKEAQERQAAIDEQGMPATVDPNSPAAQPGLAAPGQGAEAAAAVAAPDQTLQNVGNFFSRLRQPAMSVAAERTV